MSIDAIIPYVDESGNVEMIEAKLLQLSFLCRLCGKVIEYTTADNFQLLGPYTLHVLCHEVALQRLSKLTDILFLPEDEWEKWLEDEDE